MTASLSTIGFLFTLFWITWLPTVGAMETAQSASLSFTCGGLGGGGVLLNCSIAPDKCSTPAVQGPNGTLYNATVALTTPLPGTYRCLCLHENAESFTNGNATVTCTVSESDCWNFLVALVVILVGGLVLTVLLLCYSLKPRRPYQKLPPKEQEVKNRKRKWLILLPLPLVLAALGALIAVSLRPDCH